VQERLDRPAITTDIIVGFPGETDAEFAETVDAARAVGFSKIHIFPFSARRGTPAATMPDQVPKHVRQERCRELAEIEAVLRTQYYEQLIGRNLRVLLETEERGAGSEERVWSGTSCRYATVEMPGAAGIEGRFVDVIAHGIHGDRLIADQV
jgi:threonylcarbamoyladenosine tRNA methylthiotransferase MtaB